MSIILLAIILFGSFSSSSQVKEHEPNIVPCSLYQDSISTQKAKLSNRAKEATGIPNRGFVNNRNAYFQQEMRSDRAVNSWQVAEPSINVKKESYLTKYRVAGENWALVRHPKKRSSHLVFQSNDTIFYSYYSNGVWQTAETIGIGKLPCISLDLNSRPWVAYLSPDNKSLYCAVRRNNNTWKRMFIFGAGVCGSNEPEFIEHPSMMHNIYPSQPPMAYLVCTFNGSTTGNSYIQFIPFDTITRFYPSPLDVGLLQDSLKNPSIGITPKDYLHVAWQRKDGYRQSIFYRVTTEVVKPPLVCQRNGSLNWSDRAVVSTQFPPTEPASQPFVENYGDSVYVAWRGPNEEGQNIGEVWKRWKPVLPNEQWRRPPRNESQSPSQESDYPVMSTRNVTAWQESLSSNNSEIYAKVNNEIINISNTNSALSRYPHIVTRLHYPQYPDLTVDAIWTEESIPAFEVMYRHIELPCTSGGTYYSVNPGESIPSPYLEERDGYLQYEGYKIDYGRDRLIYNLPYLQPGFNYMARAIVFSSRQGRTKQNFELDDSSSKQIEFDPFQPETVWVKIPEETYGDDLEVRDRINRLIGNYAVLADLVIYQYEEYMGGGGEGGAMGDNISLSLKPVLYNCLPNPFGSQTVIRYQIPSPAIVSLKVFDITGREVRTLVNTSQKTGDYRVKWDGKDNGGKLLGNGIYFYSLKMADFTASKKLVLVR